MTSRFRPFKPASRGDTIVEVLIAIGIAAFAISISYATANRSLQQAISARERNEALNVLQNQVTDLKFRHQLTPSANFTQFEAPTVDHFCLDDSATDPSQTAWAPITNSSSIKTSSPLQANNPPTGAAPYDSKCVFAGGGGGKYYIDITATTVPGNQNQVYLVLVSWNPFSGSQLDQASVYYRF